MTPYPARPHLSKKVGPNPLLYVAPFLLLNTGGLHSSPTQTLSAKAPLVKYAKKIQADGTTLNEQTLKKITQQYGLCQKDLQRNCQQDSCLHIDTQNRLLHLCAELLPPIDKNRTNPTENKPQANHNTVEEAFHLESLPNAKKTLYLDFDGHSLNGTAWNGFNGGQTLVNRAMDLDNTPNEFSHYERQQILAIWAQVSEDFSAFEVNVTTKEPPSDALLRTSPADETWGGRVVIGGSWQDWLKSPAGGVAYLNSFGWTPETPSFAFSDDLGRNAKYIAECVSHEAGHMFNLFHDGTTNGQAYHYGSGNWAPIMGVGYSKPITQWSKGDYPLANNSEDDIAKIALHAPLKFPQEREASFHINPSETLKSVVLGTTPHILPFHVPQAELSVEIQTPEPYPNSSPEWELLTENGTRIAQGTTNKHPPLRITPGLYYLKIQGGLLEDAGSSYGSLGQYTLKTTLTNPEEAPQWAQLSHQEKIPLGETLSSPSSYTTWEFAKVNIPHKFQPLTNQTLPHLLTTPEHAGGFLRARIQNTPSGPTFTTTATRVIVDPTPQKISRTQPLLLTSRLESQPNPQKPNLLIQELSRSHPHSKLEWIEILILQKTNLQNATLTNTQNTQLRFAQHPLWKEVPGGTILVLHNGEPGDPTLPPDSLNLQKTYKAIASTKNPTLFQGQWPTLTTDPTLPTYTTGAETTLKDAYATGNVTLEGKLWRFEDALIGKEPQDQKESKQSIRIRNGGIQTLQPLPHGVKTLEFLAARSRFSNDLLDTAPELQVEYANPENPTTWLPASNTISLKNIDTLTSFEFPLNLPGPVLLKISKKSGTSGRRWNLDNLSIKPLGGEGTLTLTTADQKQTRAQYNHLTQGSSLSFQGTLSEETQNPQNWRKTEWKKPSYPEVTPGQPNSPTQTAWIETLKSPAEAHYSLLNQPHLSIDPQSGKIQGTAPNPNDNPQQTLQILLTTENQVLQETLPLLITSPLEVWLEDYQAGHPNADPDQDGVSNLWEYLYGTSPRSHNPNPQQITVLTENNKKILALNYPLSQTTESAPPRPEWSHTLSNDWNQTGITQKTLSENATHQLRRAEIPILPTETKKFLRLHHKE